MEDHNTLLADCIVISCCCQCLILQLIIFFLLKLKNVARKTKAYARRKFRCIREHEEGTPAEKQNEGLFLKLDVESFVRVLESETVHVDQLHRCGKCMEEAEKVLEELSRRGEFAFGSFWGRDDSQRI